MHFNPVMERAQLTSHTWLLLQIMIILGHTIIAFGVICFYCGPRNGRHQKPLTRTIQDAIDEAQVSHVIFRFLSRLHDVCILNVDVWQPPIIKSASPLVSPHRELTEQRCHRRRNHLIDGDLFGYGSTFGYTPALANFSRHRYPPALYPMGGTSPGSFIGSHREPHGPNYKTPSTRSVSTNDSEYSASEESFSNPWSEGSVRRISKGYRKTGELRPKGLKRSSGRQSPSYEPSSESKSTEGEPERSVATGKRKRKGKGKSKTSTSSGNNAAYNLSEDDCPRKKPGRGLHSSLKGKTKARGSSNDDSDGSPQTQPSRTY